MENRWHVCVIFLVLLSSINGSIIELESSQSSLKPLLTTNLTLRCSLKNSAPPSVIGKRSVDNLTTGQDGDHKDYSHSDSQDNGQSKRSVPVTHTDDSMQYAISVVVTRDGVDLARVNGYIAATAADGMSGFEVRGHVNNGGNSGELGYLELHWTHPSLSEAGTYKCEISALNKAGHAVEFVQTLEVNTDDVTIPDLVNYLHDLIVDKEKKDETIAKLKEDFNKTVETLTQELTSLKANTVPKADFDSLKAELSALKVDNVPKADFNTLESKFNSQKAELTSLETKFNALKAAARTEPDIFFTAGVSQSSSKSINRGVTIIYDKVYTNVGSGYGNTTGVFTAPIAGFYKFELYTSSSSGHQAIVRLRVNGVETVETGCYGSKDYNSCSNSLTTHLARGDKVDVVATTISTSTIYTDYANHPTNSFSGQLLSFA